jgi:hypothetical protein
VRIVRSCAACGGEMKEASLDLEHDGEIILSGELLTAEGSPWPGGHIKRNDETKKYEWLAGHGLEETEHDDPEQVEVSKPKRKGRRPTSYFGASIAWQVNCKCTDCLADGVLEDKIAASAMDEL